MECNFYDHLYDLSNIIRLGVHFFKHYCYIQCTMTCLLDIQTIKYTVGSTNWKITEHQNTCKNDIAVLLIIAFQDRKSMGIQLASVCMLPNIIMHGHKHATFVQ